MPANDRSEERGETVKFHHKVGRVFLGKLVTGCKWIAASIFLVGMVYAAIYVGSQDGEFTLSPLNLFFVVTTVVSLGFNLYQHVKTQNINRPLINHLVGLFNDIKNKQQACWMVGQNLYSQFNPHRDVDTLKWEYAAFAHLASGSFQQLQEAVVAAIVTLDPDDPSGHRAFRAQEYGLTEPERKLREMQVSTYLRDQQGPPAATATSSASPAASPDDSGSESEDQDSAGDAQRKLGPDEQ